MVRERIDVLLFVEHVARELDIACAIKHLIRKQYGLRLEIGSLVFHFEQTVSLWDPRIVVLPVSFSGTTLSWIRDSIRAFPSAVFVDLAYEQIYHKLNRECRTPNNDFAQRHVLHHAWGDFHVKYLREHGAVQENIVINGNPVYMLYKEPYCRYFETRTQLAKQHGLNPAKAWLLVPENYKAAFLPERKFLQYIEGGADKRETYQYREFDKSSLDMVAQWWINLAEQEGGIVEIIVRPRPATPSELIVGACQRLCGKVPEHLHVIKHGTVREWILASDIVMSSISTSLIEAAMARKPIYALMPTPLPTYLKMEWSDLVPEINTYAEFKNAVINSRHIDTWVPLRTWAETRTLGTGDAISNLVTILADLCQGRRSGPKPPGISYLGREPELTGNRWHWFRRKLPVVRWRISGWVRRRLGIPSSKVRKNKDTGSQDGRDAPWNFDFFETDEFSVVDVERRVSRWAKTLR